MGRARQRPDSPEIQSVTSAVNRSATVEDALSVHGVTPGKLTLLLLSDTYRELRRTTAMEGTDLDEVVAVALDDRLP